MSATKHHRFLYTVAWSCRQYERTAVLEKSVLSVLRLTQLIVWSVLRLTQLIVWSVLLLTQLIDDSWTSHDKSTPLKI